MLPTQLGSNHHPPDHQSDVHITEPSKQASNVIMFMITLMIISNVVLIRITIPLKGPITTAANDTLIFIYFSLKIWLDMSWELSARQTIHMKCKVIFSLKTNKKQEAHGPQLAHLSEIATADMHLLCNIFSILPLQLVKDFGLGAS